MNRNPATGLLSMCALASTMLLQGCLLGSFQTFKKIEMDCHVVSARSGLPVNHAVVSVNYQPANTWSPRLQSQEFITNSKGYCQIVVPRKTIHITAGDAFVGGYLRGIRVRAKGYEEGGLYEGFQNGMLSGVQDHKFVLNPK